MESKEIEYFLNNPEFIRWVKRESPAGELFWSHWIEKNPESHDNMMLARQIILSFQYEAPPSDHSRYHRVLSNVLSGEKSEMPSSKNAISKWLPKVAALWLLAGFVTLFWLTHKNHRENGEKAIVETIVKTNPAGVKRTIILPDSSVMHLNSESSVTYAPDFTGNREIFLEGEAYFEVKKNKALPFRVHSAHATTTVLGTSFNIKAFPEDHAIHIGLVEGSIKVKYKGSEKLIMPGEMLSIDKLSGEMTAGVVDGYGWKDGILTLKSSSLPEFIALIERWYGVSVIVTGTPDTEWEIDGRFNNMSLELVMESISFTKNVDYKIDKNKVQLMFN